MNKLALIFLLGAAPFFRLTAQQAETFKRNIEVTGVSELEIIPDEVYLSVTLREYAKVKLDDIDKKFRQTLGDLKIDMKDVSVENVSAYYDWNYWQQKQTDFFASKTYVIKMQDLSKYNQLMAKMDRQGVQSAGLQKTDHTKIEEYRRRVKIEALKAAREKAKLMLESIGEQLGEVLYIRELSQNNYYPVMYKGMANMSTSMDAESAGQGEPGMQKIKLRYEVQAQFSIK